MKRMLLLLLSVASLPGCKKDKNDPEAVFSFTVNGANYEWKGPPAFEGTARAGAAIGSGTTAFFLTAFDNSDNNYSRANFSITKEKGLAVKTYLLEGGGPSGSLSGEIMFGKGNSSEAVYACLHTGDFINITTLPLTMAS